MHGSKRSRFIKVQEAVGLLSSLGKRTGLDKNSILGPSCFAVKIQNE